MKFDKSKVYTALNADELKVGSKVIVADDLGTLKQIISNVTNDTLPCEQQTIKDIKSEYLRERFVTNRGDFALCYLISEPEEKNWIVYLIRRECVSPYLTACRNDRWESIKEEYGAKTKLFEGSKDESIKWYTVRKHFIDVIAAWEDGKTIQYNSRNGWEDCCDNKPLWDVTTEYRIKPEGLKWTDLKIGDIVHEKNGTETCMVTAIDTSNEPDDYRDICHICLGNWWIYDKSLEDWEKVE